MAIDLFISRGSMGDFLRRVDAWRIPFELSQFRKNPEAKTVPPAPLTGMAPPRMPSGHGITSGDRYAKQSRLQEMYLKIIPDQRALARELSQEDEAELFKMSASPPYYRDNFIARLKSLNDQIQFAQTLQPP
jgi:hypothetical protein